MAGLEQNSTPLDISCAHLGLIRAQAEQTGLVTIGNVRPIIPARQAILEEVVGSGKIRFVDTKTDFTQDIPETQDPFHQQRIARARAVAQKSGCWWVQVGCVVTDERGTIVTESNNSPLVEASKCSQIGLSPKEAMGMLDQTKNERLLFCSGVHDVENMVTNAAKGNGNLGGKNWYLSLEPCDRCAGILTRLDPKAVYFSLGQGRKKFYNSLGLEFLQIADVPTYYVRMPGEEAWGN